MNDDARFSFKKLVFYRLKFGVRVPISAALLDRAELLEHHASVADVVSDHIAYSLHTFVYGRDGEPVTIEYPATWWDAVKQFWFPGWKFRLTRVTVRPREMFPDWNPPESMGQRVVVAIAERSERTGWEAPS